MAAPPAGRERRRTVIRLVDQRLQVTATQQLHDQEQSLGADINPGVIHRGDTGMLNCRGGAYLAQESLLSYLKGIRAAVESRAGPQ